MARLALPPTSARPRVTRRQAQGLSLVELLIGVVISIVVLGGTVRLFISLIRSDSASLVELNRKDEVGWVLGMMQDEIRNAQRVQSGAGLAVLDANRCPTTPLLILRGATANEDISYGLLAASNTTWRGPNVLVRCGPNYNADGSLNTTANPLRSEQVILDTLCTTTTPGCNALNGFTAVTAANNVTRNVQLNLNSVVSGTRLSSSVQVPISLNQIYGLASSGATGCATGCPDPNGSIHYRPTLGGSNITGSSSLEDIFYFDGRRADYTLSRSPGSGLCTNAQCTVRLGPGGNSITFTDGDVLVFRDMQIRL